jgi:hypothetical protein
MWSPAWTPALATDHRRCPTPGHSPRAEPPICIFRKGSTAIRWGARNWIICGSSEPRQGMRGLPVSLRRLPQSQGLIRRPLWEISCSGCLTTLRLTSGGALKPLSDPDLDNRLTCNTQPPSFPVKRFDHPCREIDVDPALLEPGRRVAARSRSPVTSSPSSNFRSILQPGSGALRHQGNAAVSDM